MLNKIFSHGSGGSKGVMDYMLREKDKITTRDGMTVLRGDVELQAQLIDSLISNQKQHYVSGCWSFEESPDQVTEAQKNEIMDGTERLMLAGLDPDRVSITWIEHTDKGRLELNYIVACVDLEHGRVFQPYVHSHDRDRWNAFRDIQNITHGFTEPNDPAKAQTVAQSDNLPRTTKELKEQITATLESQVVQGLITNRDDVKQALTELGYTITRAGKDSISIKNPDPEGRNIKFKSTNEGGLYDIKFNASSEAASEISRASADFGASANDRLADAQRVFERELKHKSDFHEQRHSKPMRVSRGHDREAEQSLEQHEHSNSPSPFELPQLNAPSSYSRTRNNDNATQPAQRRDDTDVANTQRERQHDHQDSIKAILHISPSSSSFNIDVRHPFWSRYSENTLNTTVKKEVSNEQAATRSSQRSDASAARHDSASEFDAQSERSRYKRIERFINEVVRVENSANRSITRFAGELERVNEIVNTTSSSMVASTVEDTEQSADFNKRAVSDGAESDKLNKSNKELSRRIAEVDEIEARSEKLRSRIGSAEPFTEKNQYGVDKIERYFEVKDAQNRAQRDAKPDPIIEAYNNPAEAERSYPTPFDRTPYDPPSPYR